VRELSAEFDAIFVEFQGVFNKALAKAPAEYWIWDGIHPMPAGHELMAREWILRKLDLSRANKELSSCGPAVAQPGESIYLLQRD
jgi:hypothetical protein